MQVECDVTPDDVATFSRHVLSTHPEFRRTYMLGFLAGPAIGLLVLVLTGAQSVLGTFAKIVIPTIIFSGFYVHFYRKQIDENARRAAGTEPSSGVVGKRTMTISPDGFQEVSAHATNSQRWSGIIKVEDGGTAIYLFNAPGAAYIVPKRAFSDQARLAEFLDTVARFREAGRA